MGKRYHLRKVKTTEDLTQILEIINAKGDTGELEEIVEDAATENESNLPGFLKF